VEVRFFIDGVIERVMMIQYVRATDAVTVEQN